VLDVRKDDEQLDDQLVHIHQRHKRLDDLHQHHDDQGQLRPKHLQVLQSKLTNRLK
jgi:hypothetical protein